MRKKLIIIFSIYFGFEFVGIAYQIWGNIITENTHERLVVDFIRIVLALLLFWAIYNFKNWARILVGVLFLIGGFLGICLSAMTLNQLPELSNLDVSEELMQIISLAKVGLILILSQSVFNLIAGNIILRMDFPKKIDPVEEIRRYKQLLEEGILTEEEFEKKKKHLLENSIEESEVRKPKSKNKNIS